VRGVQRRRQQGSGQLAQRARARGWGQRHGLHVARDVEPGVIDPLQVAEPEPRVRQAPAEARHVLQASPDVAAQRR
jgi:hypothetical protein